MRLTPMPNEIGCG